MKVKGLLFYCPIYIDNRNPVDCPCLPIPARCASAASEAAIGTVKGGGSPELVRPWPPHGTKSAAASVKHATLSRKFENPGLQSDSILLQIPVYIGSLVDVLLNTVLIGHGIDHEGIHFSP